MKKSNFNPLQFAVLHRLIVLVFLWSFVGFSYSQQSDNQPLEILYNAYQQLIDEGKLAGVETLVIHKDSVVWHKAQGYKDLDQATLLQPHSLFYIQSMTKPIISVAVMQLVEKGLIGLDEPIKKYIPEVGQMNVSLNPEQGIDGPQVASKTDISIRQLLTHTSGLSHGLSKSKLDKQLFKALYDETLNYKEHANLESRLEALLGFPLVAQPGTKWYYSAGADLLALLLQRVSQMPIPEYLNTHIFQPLGMEDTGYNLTSEQSERLMRLHSVDANGKLGVHELQVPTAGNTVFGGTHGLFSTAHDYAKFCLMIAHNGRWNGNQVLKPETVSLIAQNHVGGLYNEKGAGFGLGFSVILDPELMNRPGKKGQLQWGGYFSTHFFIDPQAELIALAMTQRMPANHQSLGALLADHAYEIVD
ncbi:MAG: serine hydrolase domain-containing protein [Flavobacteriaceae bacterium]